MPAIARGSSARSRRRQALEDNIEDGEPTQRSRTEDVEDAEDEQAARVSKKNSRGSRAINSKESKAQKSHRNGGEGAASDEDDQEEVSGLAMEIENFRDQPLSKANTRTIAGMAEDWEQVKKNMRSSTLPLVEQIAVAMAEAGENKDGEEALKDLEQTDLLMRELLDLQAELTAHEDTLKGIVNDISRGEEISNAIQRYTIGVEDRKEARQAQTTRQKYAKDDDYIRFKSSIYEVQHPDEGMPPLTSLIPSEEGDDSDDDEIAVGGVSQVYTCPLSLTILEKPVTSQICKHTFSKANIEDYLGANRSLKKKCPAAGCSKMVCMSDFKSNPEVEKRVKAHMRREQLRQAEVDSENEAVEEIIE